jgi:hypothetical protein
MKTHRDDPSFPRKAVLVLLTATLGMVAVWSSAVSRPLAVEAASKHLVYRRAFRAQIHQGPSAGLVVAGALQLEINLSAGSFTGTITPGTDSETGLALPTVLFQLEGDVVTPSALPVTALQVRGSVAGHAVNFVVLDVGGPGKNLHLAGTTEHLVGRGRRSNPGQIKGVVVGPDWGSTGDFGGTCFCIDVTESSTGKVVLRVCVLSDTFCRRLAPVGTPEPAYASRRGAAGLLPDRASFPGIAV